MGLSILHYDCISPKFCEMSRLGRYGLGCGRNHEADPILLVCVCLMAVLELRNYCVLQHVGNVVPTSLDQVKGIVTCIRDVELGTT